MVQYLELHPEITDVLITGGDPMIMSARRLATYVDALLDSKAAHLKTIRIGTRTLSFWPYRYLTDKDSKDILKLFKKITDRGIFIFFTSPGQGLFCFHQCIFNGQRSCKNRKRPCHVLISGKNQN